MQLGPKFDIPTACKMHPAMLEETSKSEELAIDCSALQSFTAAGAQLVVSGFKTIDGAGGSLNLTNVPEWLGKDFDLLGLSEIFRRINSHE